MRERANVILSPDVMSYKIQIGLSPGFFRFTTIFTSITHRYKKKPSYDFCDSSKRVALAFLSAAWTPEFAAALYGRRLFMFLSTLFPKTFQTPARIQQFVS